MKRTELRAKVSTPMTLTHAWRSQQNCQEHGIWYVYDRVMFKKSHWKWWNSQWTYTKPSWIRNISMLGLVLGITLGGRITAVGIVHASVVASWDLMMAISAISEFGIPGLPSRELTNISHLGTRKSSSCALGWDMWVPRRVRVTPWFGMVVSFLSEPRPFSVH